MTDDQVQDTFGAPVDDTYEFWALEAGIQQKWVALGKTTVFGQYYNYDGGAIFRSYDDAFDNGVPGAQDVGRILSSELNIYSLGVMQGIDNAAMNVYAMYRHVEAEAETENLGKMDFQDVDLFMTGAIIKF
jgi:hypothetical protein